MSAASQFTPSLFSEMQRLCRFCGCSAFDACQDASGNPCYWIDTDVCSECRALLNAERAQ